MAKRKSSQPPAEASDGVRRAIETGLSFEEEIDLVQRVWKTLRPDDPLNVRITAAVARMEAMRLQKPRQPDDQETVGLWLEVVADCSAIQPPARVKVRAMDPVQRAQLLISALEVLPATDPMRTRIDDFFERFRNRPKIKLGAMSQAEIDAALPVLEEFQTELEDLAVAAWRLIQ